MEPGKLTREEAIEKLQALVGTDISSLAKENGVTIWKFEEKDGQIKKTFNKGWFGELVERILGLPKDTRQEPDFGDWELKTTSVYRKKSGKLGFKETIQITTINKSDVIKRKFYESHLYDKLKNIVLVVRLKQKETWDDTGIIYFVTWFDLSDEEILKTIEQDYEIARQALIAHADKDDNDLTCLHSKMGKYVQPRTKGKGRETRENRKTRAFYARASFVTKMFGQIINNIPQKESSFPDSFSLDNPPRTPPLI